MKTADAKRHFFMDEAPMKERISDPNATHCFRKQEVAEDETDLPGTVLSPGHT
jgi:hypothetical protein